MAKTNKPIMNREIVDKIHFYLQNPHLNPMDIDYDTKSKVSKDIIEIHENE